MSNPLHVAVLRLIAFVRSHDHRYLDESEVATLRQLDAAVFFAARAVEIPVPCIASGNFGNTHVHLAGLHGYLAHRRPPKLLCYVDWCEAMDRLDALAMQLPVGTNQVLTVDVHPPEPKPMVELRGLATGPIVCGNELELLTEPRYRVIEALLKAGPDGMKKSELEVIKSDAVKYLRELRNGSQWWKAAIRMAGKAWGRYAIVWE